MESHKLSFCSDCSSCVSQMSFKTHKISCSKKRINVEYLCDQCNYSSPYKKTLNAHIKAHEDGLLQHQCNICRKSFKSIALVESHRGKFHKEQFQCNICDKNFTTKSKRDNHLKTHNPKVKPVYPCTDCEFQCESSSALKRHQAVHHKTKKERKLHQCPDCEYKTPWQSNMMRHKRRRHSPRKPVVFSALQMWKMMSRRLMSMKHGKAFFKELRDHLGKEKITLRMIYHKTCISFSADGKVKKGVW